MILAIEIARAVIFITTVGFAWVMNFIEIARLNEFQFRLVLINVFTTEIA